jgi:hypothetical protein
VARNKKLKRLEELAKIEPAPAEEEVVSETPQEVEQQPSAESLITELPQEQPTEESTQPTEEPSRYHVQYGKRQARWTFQTMKKFLSAFGWVDTSEDKTRLFVMVMGIHLTVRVIGGWWMWSTSGLDYRRNGMKTIKRWQWRIRHSAELDFLDGLHTKG